MTDSVLPCPFCNTSDSLDTFEQDLVWRVKCLTCCTVGPYEGQEEWAIRAWNTRHSGWVSVEERLPDEDSDYGFLVSNGTFTTCGRYLKNKEEKWCTPGGHAILFDITHWMPLPAPPENNK